MSGEREERLTEYLRLLVRNIRECERICEMAGSLDADEYWRVCAERLCDARQAIWPHYYRQVSGQASEPGSSSSTGGR